MELRTQRLLFLKMIATLFGRGPDVEKVAYGSVQEFPEAAALLAIGRAKSAASAQQPLTLEPARIPRKVQMVCSTPDLIRYQDDDVDPVLCRW